jgi:hypothetical protein
MISTRKTMQDLLMAVSFCTNAYRCVPLAKLAATADCGCAQ